MNEKILAILDGLKTCDGAYNRELVDAAIELKTEITPHLIKILENVLSDPTPYIENEDRFDHIYALMLLGYFRETAAHSVIIDMFSIPGETPYNLYGDIGSENLPLILVTTCGGSLDRIKTMARDQTVDEYNRVSALNALAYAVLEGYISRKEVLAFFEPLFTESAAREGSDFFSLMAMIAEKLYPEEIMDTIRNAYEEGLISEGMIRYEDFDSALKKGKEDGLNWLKRDMKQSSLDDIHNSMSWWACFNPESREPAPSIPTFSPPSKSDRKKLRNKRKAKKRKRKMAKAAKRKNRR